MYQLSLPAFKADESIVGVAVLKADKILVATNMRVIVVAPDARGSLPGSDTKARLTTDPVK